MRVVSLRPSPHDFFDAFLVPEVLNPAGVGRSSYSSPSVGRRGARLSLPLLLSIPTFFSKLVENSIWSSPFLAVNKCINNLKGFINKSY